MLVLLGGCLIGFKADEGAEPAATTESDTDVDTDADTDADTVPATDTSDCVLQSPEDEICATFEGRDVSVSAGLVPTITWTGGPSSDLYIYKDWVLQWHVWGSDGRDSMPSGVVYGETTALTSEGGPAEPLVAGQEYVAQLDVVCLDEACEDVWESFYAAFTP